MHHTIDDIRRLSGSPDFERGEVYFKEGAVLRLHREKRRVFAEVEGGSVYRVVLEETENGIRAACTCPRHADGYFCKHAVAVALSEIGTRKIPEAGRLGPDVEAWLESQDKSKLVTEMVRLLRRRPYDWLAMSFRVELASMSPVTFDGLKSALEPLLRLPMAAENRNAPDLVAALREVLIVLRARIDDSDRDVIGRAALFVSEALSDIRGDIDDPLRRLDSIANDYVGLAEAAGVVAR